MPIQEWVDRGLGRRVGAIGGFHHRRVRYIQERAEETLDEVDSVFPDLTPAQRRRVRAARKMLQANVKQWARSHREFGETSRGYKFEDVIRRLKDNSELGALRITELDAELFAACLILRRHEVNLQPKERSVLKRRIHSEVKEYLSHEKDYADLSTIWWGVKILCAWPELPLSESVELIRSALRFTVTEFERQGQRILKRKLEESSSYEMNGDLNTWRRSLTFCFQNANWCRDWLNDLHDPRVSALVFELRRWSDMCISLWLQEAQPKGFYDTALDLSMCVAWGKSRIRLWKEGLQVSKASRVKRWNRSSIDGISTSDAAYARSLEDLAESINVFRKFGQSDRPLVVGLFGPAGAGKSLIAKKVESLDSSKRLEINLATLQSPRDLFNRIQTAGEITLLFLDEFDVELGDGFWYRWLLTLTWDGEIPSEVAGNTVPLKLPKGLVIFLAASRFEKFAQFRDEALEVKLRPHKAVDLMTRIDLNVDIPRLAPKDRALVMFVASKGRADSELLLLSYIAALDDNARGLTKLLKGTSGKSRKIGIRDLLSPMRTRLLQAAGIEDF